VGRFYFSLRGHGPVLCRNAPPARGREPLEGRPAFARCVGRGLGGALLLRVPFLLFYLSLDLRYAFGYVEALIVHAGLSPRARLTNIAAFGGKYEPVEHAANDCKGDVGRSQHQDGGIPARTQV
jgi:hypothetical protein